MVELAGIDANPDPDGGAPVGSKYIADAEEIGNILRFFRDEAATLTIRVDGVAGAITARILEVSKDNLLIDDVRPRTALTNFRTGAKFSIACRVQGSYIYLANNQVIAVRSDGTLPYFEIRTDSSMLFQKLRRTERLNLPLKLNTQQAVIWLMPDSNLCGQVVDISTGGCRAIFSSPPTTSLKVEDRFEECFVDIPKLLDLNTEVTVRNLVSGDNNSLTCGFEFTQMSITNRRRLENLVSSLTKVSHLK